MHLTQKWGHRSARQTESDAAFTSREAENLGLPKVCIWPKICRKAKIWSMQLPTGRKTVHFSQVIVDYNSC